MTAEVTPTIVRARRLSAYCTEFVFPDGVCVLRLTYVLVADAYEQICRELEWLAGLGAVFTEPRALHVGGGQVLMELRRLADGRVKLTLLSPGGSLTNRYILPGVAAPSAVCLASLEVVNSLRPPVAGDPQRVSDAIPAVAQRIPQTDYWVRLPEYGTISNNIVTIGRAGRADRALTVTMRQVIEAGLASLAAGLSGLPGGATTRVVEPPPRERQARRLILPESD